MFQPFSQAALATVKSLASQSGNGVALINRTLRSLLTTAQHTLMLFGLGSLILLGLLYAKPESLNRLQAGINRISQPPAAELAQATPPTITASQTMQADSANALDMPSRAIGHDKHSKSTLLAGTSAAIAIPVNGQAMQQDSDTLSEQRVVSSWLSKRYRVAGDATQSLVTTAYQTASEIKFDPLLILAVVAIESRFNPIAESPMGAQGLMQVMSKVHHEKFKSLGGIKEALNPVANIKVGALILKDYVSRGGSVEAGLKSYVGAGAFASDTGYGSQVMAEYQRLKQVAQGKSVQVPAAVGGPVLPVARKDAPTDEAKASEKDDVVAL